MRREACPCSLFPLYIKMKFTLNFCFFFFWLSYVLRGTRTIACTYVCVRGVEIETHLSEDSTSTPRTRDRVWPFISYVSVLLIFFFFLNMCTETSSGKIEYAICDSYLLEKFTRPQLKNIKPQKSFKIYVEIIYNIFCMLDVCINLFQHTLSFLATCYLHKFFFIFILRQKFIFLNYKK